MEAEESKPVPTLGLSKSFDSINATMKLAALTNDEKDVEELSKTLKMARPSVNAINQAAPAAARQRAPQAAALSRHPASEQDEPARWGNWLLILIVVLVLAGLLKVIFF